MASNVGLLTVQVRGLVRRYDERAVLDGLDLDIEPGEFGLEAVAGGAAAAAAGEPGRVDQPVVREH